jgi:threonine synthase
MTDIHELRCPLCERAYRPRDVMYTCPACGEVGTLDVLYDYDILRRRLDRRRLAHLPDAGMWRYRALLPLAPDAPLPPLRVGWTPLYDAPRLAADLGLSWAWVKDEGQNPTASLKDRASALIVARARAQKTRIVSAASTGNAAAALAGIAASVGQEVIIFVPASAPEAKIAQLLVYGARVLLVEGTYDQAFDLCLSLSVEQGWYCRNTGVNPYTAEGKKTAAFEIAEQLSWRVPDVVVVSVGDGNIIGGVHKGFTDLHRLGWIERIPRLIGVQAEGSSALVDAWTRGLSAAEMVPMPADTIADSISAGLPRDRVKALRAVRETAGAFVAVSDSEIIAAIPQLARLTGVFAEPAAAAVYAGARLAVQSGVINSDERALLLITGNGLKDVRRAQESVGGAVRVQPDPDSVRQVLHSL